MDHEKLKRAIKENKERVDGRKPRHDTKLVPSLEPNVKAIRNSLGMSQSEFAAAFWLSLNSVRNWEQGIRNPEGAARAYFTAIQYDAASILAALNRSMIERLSAQAVAIDTELDDQIKGEVPTVVGDFGVGRVRDLTGAIEPLHESGRGQSLAASSRKPGADRGQSAIAQLVDVSGLSFAKVFLGEDALVSLEIGVSGNYNRLILGGHEFEVQDQPDGLNRVVGLTVAEFLSLIKDGVKTACLKAG